MTSLEEKSGWQTDESKLFVRVNISPGPDNEATLFVSFTKPYFPEYIFYNQLENRIKITHKSTAIQQDKINDIYDFVPNSRQAIVLNPNDKDEDILQIYILNASGDPISHTPFEYEIDSMKLHFCQNAQKKFEYTIITKLSGSLRFIHLMSRKQWSTEKRRRKRELLKSASNRRFNNPEQSVESDDEENEDRDDQNLDKLLEEALDLQDEDDV